ncbi:DUF2147 domain-containing protein [Endozoicomonas sp. 8E]|uniref:DUF2147 domain-containing protein n=1 Tax=Endozoicomonas sp. 8E TaxID=3035692 RepID=UPI0029392B54|nr:DUF2147 domain-containing protein [Endozoicomonas sp. 8E]WOG29036.1 DUF2147 domain-containing protein [Endozoicomonas sp. 8E]
MLRKALLAASALLIPVLSFANGYVGEWYTVNEETNKKESLVTIWQEGDQLKGKIVEILDPASRDAVCEKCKGDKKNQKIEGMTFLWGMKKEGSEYDNGNVLDPKSGRVYSGSMKLIDGGQKLELRGYLGFSLLGRTSVWVKAD